MTALRTEALIIGTALKSGLTLAGIDELRKGNEITEREYRSLELAGIVREIVGLLDQHIHFTYPSTALLLAFWVVNTYLYEAFEYCGYVHLRSAKPGSGKTVLLEVMAKLSFGSPSVLTAPTAATIYRSPTRIFFFDEVEGLGTLSDGAGAVILAVLNAGFKKGAAVTRNVKVKNGDYAHQLFPCYGPKALAGLSSLQNSALESRCFFILMAQATSRLKRLRHNTLERAASPLRTRLGRWSQVVKPWLEYTNDTLDGRFDELSKYSHRFQDIAEPLFILSSFADRHTESSLTPLLLEGLQQGFHMKAMEADLTKCQQQGWR